MYQFTSESVSSGHPDKIADRISDAVATYLIDGKLNHRAAVETLVTTNMVTLAGEYKSDKFDKVYIEKLVRAIVRDIGYEQDGFHWDKLKVYNELHGQSPDIALGTDNFGAGDQGLMFGYACNETPNLLPSAIYYSHRILQRLEQERRTGATWLLPDSKAQVTMSYTDVNSPVSIDKIVCSTQHVEDLSIDDVRERVESIIRDEITEYDLSETEFLLTQQAGLLSEDQMEILDLLDVKLLLILMAGMLHMVGVHLAVKTVLKSTDQPHIWLAIWQRTL